MCQKQFGSFYGPFITSYGVVWTCGEPKRFQSSNKASRGFCADCGTPLTFEAFGYDVELAIGAFDDPTLAAPALQVNLKDKLAFIDGLPGLPVRNLAEDPEQEAFNRSVVNYQHPDHDTASWPLRK